MLYESKKHVVASQEGDVEASMDTPSDVNLCCVCGKSGGCSVQQCSKCHSTQYCSKECQRKHFPYHAQYCSAIVDLKKLETDKWYKNFSVREEQVDAKSRRKFVNLIGEKPVVNCYLDGENCAALWDTGSMISVVDFKWVKKNFPDKTLHSVDNFLQNDNLQVRAANSTEIPYEGVILLEFSLKSDVQGFTVPFLVTSQPINEPILGYNVIENVVKDDVQKSKLSSCLLNTCSAKVETVVSLIQERSKCPDLLDTVKAPETMKIAAGSSLQLKCKVKVLMDKSEQTINFIPRNLKNEADVLVFF